jgi:hypothetical protein
MQISSFSPDFDIIPKYTDPDITSLSDIGTATTSPVQGKATKNAHSQIIRLTV